MVQFIMGHLSADEFTEGPARDLIGVLLEMFQKGTIDRDTLVGGSVGDDIQQLATELLTNKYELSQNWEKKLGITTPGNLDDPEAVALSAIGLLKMDRLKDLIKQAQQDLFNAEQDGADPTPFLEQMSDLQRQRRVLETGSWI